MSEKQVNTTYEYAIDLDKNDELSSYREEFYLNEKKIYLDGNSLGLLSKRAEKSLMDILQSWRDYGIDGWTEGEHPWFYLSERLGASMAALVGANTNEVIVTGSTTSNLHQLLATFFQPNEQKNKILTDELSFPTDVYAMQSQLKLHGYNPKTHLIKVKSGDGHLLKEEDIIEAMTADVALIVLPSILYRSGQILDLKRLTEEAHKREIIIGFDLCHSIGAIPHQLSESNVDFAFWCNYKHLNGGPGTVGALYVNHTHFGKAPGLAGWFSSKKQHQFDMAHELIHEHHAGAFQMGTPHVLSVAPLIGSLAMFNEVGINNIRRKSLRLTGYMLDLIDHELKEYEFIVRNPREDKMRGGHIFLEHPEAARICKALKAEGVVPDFRSPNGIRLAPVALYNSFEDIWTTIQKLKRIMAEQTYKKFENKRGVIA
ncbi:kynureninase [Litchfieldia alkalitelluris]|uniref:kynureninase n=1 Tax=Litchfieldia alkalitelluris TaxID=304268 RepID=UPI0009980301|nr:kynureninase [Litchfieldia alkalitelluris]